MDPAEKTSSSFVCFYSLLYTLVLEVAFIKPIRLTIYTYHHLLVDMANLLANSYLVIHSAVTEQHYHSFFYHAFDRLMNAVQYSFSFSSGFGFLQLLREIFGSLAAKCPTKFTSKLLTFKSFFTENIWSVQPKNYELKLTIKLGKAAWSCRFR